MTNSPTYVLALIVSLSMAGAASQGVAKTRSNATRESTIQKCMAQAVSEYPRTGPDGNDSARVATYKACMAAAGLAP
jgi:hypothetical protein